MSAGYDYGINNGVLWIIDQNNGRMSVTNDIENVIIDICNRERDLELSIAPTIYRDSEGCWDGWDSKENKFVHLGAATREEATELIRSYYLNQHIL